MANSPLVKYTRLSPNHSGKRIYPITRISPHCVVGQLSIESLGEWFSRTSTQASCNYGIGKDGRIGLICDEANRSWCTSSRDNDNRAITIECASGLTSPYAINDSVWKSLVNLCFDICWRYNKRALLWIPDKDTALNYKPKSDEIVLTIHQWFKNKACPGDDILSRLPLLAETVTNMLAPPAEIIKEVEEEMAQPIFNRMDEMPEYARPTIAKLVGAGALKGQGGPKDEEGYPTDMALTLDMIRMLVINDRMGVYK